METQLRRAFEQPLPGLDAQSTLAPRPRPGWRAGHFPDSARAAAVLLFVFPAANGEAHMILTQRAAALAKHAGQISLPGGAVDPAETIEGAALREAREEIGLDPTYVRVLGTLTKLHVPVSGFTLYPVVAVADVTPALHPAEGEVDRIISVSIDELLQAARIHETRVLRNGVEYEVPHFLLCGEQVWGATAMVLAEFRWILRK